MTKKVESWRSPNLMPGRPFHGSPASLPLNKVANGAIKKRGVTEKIGWLKVHMNRKKEKENWLLQQSSKFTEYGE